MPQQPRGVPVYDDDGRPLYDDTGAQIYEPIATGQQTEPNTIGTFVRHAWDQVNPANMAQAVQHPIDTIKGMGAAQGSLFEKAKASYQQGDYPTAARHFINYLLPLAGPVLDKASDEMQRGEYAAGAGDTIGAGFGMFGPQAVVEGAGALAKSGLGQRIAKGAQEGATARAVDVMAPKVGGQKKIRLANQAEGIAPDMLRGTSAITKSGLLGEVTGKLDAAHEALDAAYDAIPAAQMYPTKDIILSINNAIRRQQATGSAASVTPAVRKARVAALEQAKDELSQMGIMVNADNLRKLKGAWGEGAKKVYAPATLPDFLEVRGSGSGWADANTALTDYLVGQHPELKPLNADVSLWRKASDVMEAAKETERTRPEVMRTILARGTGAATGASSAGAGGAVVGAILGPLIEKAITGSGPARKLIVARSLQQLSDALRGGSAPAIDKAFTLLRVLPANVAVKAGVTPAMSSAGGR